MKLLKLKTTKKDNEYLRQISKPVTTEELNSKVIQDLINNMIYTAEKTEIKKGWITAGLAAIQVGVPLQIIVSRDVTSEEFTVYINPKLRLMGGAMDVNLEACLSVPDIEGEVVRHKRVKVSYLDREGNKIKRELKGFSARILQHEYDHLQGILFTDKMI